MKFLFFSQYQNQICIFELGNENRVATAICLFLSKEDALKFIMDRTEFYGEIPNIYEIEITLKTIPQIEIDQLPNFLGMVVVKLNKDSFTTIPIQKYLSMN